MSPIIQAHMLALAPHPSALGDAVRSVEARLARAADGGLTLRYCVEGDPRRMCLPPPRPPRRADELWRHTCLEAFVAADPGAAYVELNFSPSGEWASYTFSAYRTGMAIDEQIEAPAITVKRDEDVLILDAAVRLTCLRAGTAARVALAAVIEESSGSLSYWALEHPAAKPDFHHPRSFTLRI